ncbi:hypothetical protein CTI12_AA105790 [Artemisia annua]|uniref:MSP domain-containing protein n=1 Tax=Artemisia annua TaxID=35608 RepID=A0A2U1PW16_ARTAN|nr:hypothetical protein CTI12_AA105790 [Artemisia annua]
MEEDLWEIQPDELRFVFGPEKQISCILKMVNNSNRHIAFKIKVTHPKLFCVRPNRGIVKPHTTTETTITRLAQNDHVISKEGLMIERTFVPEDTSNEDVASIFSSNGNKDIIVSKLKVYTDVIPRTEVGDIESKIEEHDLMLKETQKMVSTLKSEIKELNLRVKKAENSEVSEVKKKKKGSCIFIRCFNNAKLV